MTVRLTRHSIEWRAKYLTDSYCIDYNDYLTNDNDDDEKDDDNGNDDVKQRR